MLAAGSGVEAPWPGRSGRISRRPEKQRHELREVPGRPAEAVQEQERRPLTPFE